MIQLVQDKEELYKVYVNGVLEGICDLLTCEEIAASSEGEAVMVQWVYIEDRGREYYA